MRNFKQMCNQGRPSLQRHHAKFTTRLMSRREINCENLDELFVFYGTQDGTEGHWIVNITFSRTFRNN